MNGIFKVKLPDNEPVLSYAPGSKERQEVKKALDALTASEVEIPCIIGGKEVRTGDIKNCVMPHNHGKVIGRYHQAGPKEIEAAAKAAGEASRQWAGMSYEHRLSVFLKAGDLLAGPWRSTMNAAAMLGLSKNVFQAEIDAACELIDFFRFNAYYANEIFTEQPPHSSRYTWNRMDYRPLEGFVFAATPFNFVSIAGNLPSSPAMMGNTVLWKPASSAVYPAYYIMKLFMEAGLPEGVINFLPGSGSVVGPMILPMSDLAGIHFTGSTAVFRGMWEAVGSRIASYRSYPRIVGETGGKDFILAHESADADELVTALLRGAFEFQGQKCSAASRAYIPRELWKTVKKRLLEQVAELKMGDVADFRNFINAVIDREAFDKIKGYLDYTAEASDGSILCGGTGDNRVGYFISPTVIETSNPRFKTMEEEIFGPVLTVHPYDGRKYEEVLELCDKTSPYGLTGAVFARSRGAVARAEEVLSQAAGNFYINDKPTGAVVGQQPFGGGRASGTNDKAGSILNMMRWTSPRAIKENFVPPKDYRYPFMQEE
ncbi:MAG: L-glutamate gamma-semialdehyde dehydrogenase [Spirochaetales bacterium]|nr:L-glutamate gamma-semialdehyde dehydrogenase [Spirochaetales bacterium]